MIWVCQGFDERDGHVHGGLQCHLAGGEYLRFIFQVVFPARGGGGGIYPDSWQCWGRWGV